MELPPPAKDQPPVAATGADAPAAAPRRVATSEWADLDELISELSTSFIALPSGAIDAAVGDAQRRVCECAGLEGSVLWQWNPADPDLISITHSHLPGRGPLPPMPVHAHEYFPWAFGRLRAGETLVIPSVELVPPEAARDLEVWRQYGVRATAIFPLSAGGGPLMAILSFHYTSGERTWPQPLVGRLRLVAQIFANAIARAASDRALRDHQALLATAVEISELGFYELMGGETVSFLGGRIRDILGMQDHEEVMPRTRWLEAVHAEDRDRVLALSQLALSGGQDHTSVQYRYRHPERGVTWIDHRSYVLERDDSGLATRVVGVLRDITRRKQSELELHELAEFNRTILASIVDAIAILDGEGKVVAVNEAWERWVHDPETEGLLSGLTVGGDYFAACRPLWSAHDLEGLVSVLAGSRDFHRAEYSTPGRRGFRSHQVDVMPLRRAGGGVVVLHRDITERRRTDEELSRLRAESWHAHRVAQAGAIAASLAHELNQPLSAILSNAQAALRLMSHPQPDLAELREILTDIVSDDNRAAAVIAGLRTMLRREQSQREPVQLAKAIQDVLLLVRTETLTHAVRVQQQTAPDVVLPANRVQLQQVLLNLVANGIEAMRDVAPEERLLEISWTEPADGTVTIAIRDRGPGIAEQARERVFDAFWSTKATGMGIGLPISRSIIEAHGGQLWFENRPDRGTTFFVSLPAGRPGAADTGA